MSVRPPRESATVILLRNGDHGLETFMVRRHLASDFIGGAYVFPGGTLDEDDCSAGVLALYAGCSAERAGGLLDLSGERALGHWGAAIRETFEEAGVLLATRHGALVRMQTEAEQGHWTERRRALLDKEMSWEALLTAEGLELACDRVYYFAHWVTPEGVPKRFTTRFFLAAVPETQMPLADDREVDEGVWVTPAEALARHARNEMTMIFPTLKTLEELATFRSVEAAIAACRDRHVVTNLPRVVQGENGPQILLPGDAGYDEAAGQPPVAFDPQSAQPTVSAVEVAPAIRKLLAPNPGMMTGPGTNTYILGERDLVVVDPGPADRSHVDAILATAADLGGVVRAIWLTHAHPDHALAVHALRERTDAPLVAWATPNSTYPIPGLPAPDLAAADGEDLRVDGSVYTALHTPGHASDHLCFFRPHDRQLLTGDVVVGIGTVVIAPPDGDLAAYLATLDRLAALDAQQMHPGHGEAIANPGAKLAEYKAHRLAREAQVLQRLTAGLETVDTLVAEIYSAVDPRLHRVAAKQVLGHLLKLEGERRVRRSGDTWQPI